MRRWSGSIDNDTDAPVARGDLNGGANRTRVHARCEHRGDLVQDGRVVDRRGHRHARGPRRSPASSRAGSCPTASSAAVRRRASRGSTPPRRSGRAPSPRARRASSSGSRSAPAFSTTRPSGTCPRSSSGTPMTAHSATSGCAGHDLLDRPGREAVTGDVDDVVDPPHHEQVAVVVHAAAVAGDVVARERRQVARAEAVVVAPQRRQRARRQRQPDRDRALLARGGLRPVAAQDADVVAGHGPGRRSGLDRQALDAEAVGGDRPAGLGLPPVVDHRPLAEHALGPQVGVGVEPLAGEEERLEPGQVVARRGARPRDPPCGWRGTPSAP